MLAWLGLTLTGSVSQRAWAPVQETSVHALIFFLSSTGSRVIAVLCNEPFFLYNTCILPIFLSFFFLYNTCILPIFLYGSECWAVTKRDVHKIDALGSKLLGIKWYHYVRNDDVRRTTEQPHLSSTVQARRLSVFGHIAWMPDESDAKQILSASPQENWRRHQDVPVVRGWRLFSRTWNQWTCPWTKQSTWLRIVHSAGWCLRLALRTQSGACQKRTNECLIRVVELLSCCVDRSANKRYYAGQPSVKPDWSSSVLPGVPWLPVHSEVDMLQHFFNNSRNIYTQQWCTIISSRAGAI